jgi:P27 family predicted phage terminase small subunit
MKPKDDGTPASLSKEAQALWKKYRAEFDLSDVHGQNLLLVALEAFDRMRGAQAEIAKQGVSYIDRTGAPKANPVAMVERDARNAMVAALRALNLDVLPAGKPGRPPKGR